MFKWKVTGLGGVSSKKAKDQSVANGKLNNAQASSTDHKNNKNKEQGKKDNKKMMNNERCPTFDKYLDFFDTRTWCLFQRKIFHGKSTCGTFTVSVVLDYVDRMLFGNRSWTAQQKINTSQKRFLAKTLSESLALGYFCNWRLRWLEVISYLP